MSKNRGSQSPQHTLQRQRRNANRAKTRKRLAEIGYEFPAPNPPGYKAFVKTNKHLRHVHGKPAGSWALTVPVAATV